MSVGAGNWLARVLPIATSGGRAPLLVLRDSWRHATLLELFASCCSCTLLSASLLFSSQILLAGCPVVDGASSRFPPHRSAPACPFLAPRAKRPSNPPRQSRRPCRCSPPDPSSGTGLLEMQIRLDFDWFLSSISSQMQIFFVSAAWPRGRWAYPRCDAFLIPMHLFCWSQLRPMRLVDSVALLWVRQGNGAEPRGDSTAAVGCLHASLLLFPHFSRFGSLVSTSISVSHKLSSSEYQAWGFFFIMKIEL